MSIASNIKHLREAHGMSQAEFGNIAGVTDKAVSSWETGKKEPRMGAIQKIADHFGIKKSDIIEEPASSEFKIPSGFFPLPRTVKKPRLGCIVCGDPIDSPENLDGYDDVPENIHCDFTLRCEGDSMTDARINDGDIVYIRQQEQVDNGTIAAVSIDGEKTLKRVYWDGKTLILQPANPKYQPYVYSGEILNTVRIIGKAVGFTSVIK